MGLCGTERETSEPGGFCVLACTVGAATADGLYCQTLPAGAGLLQRCDGDNPPCRDGWVCQISPTSHIGTCQPVCSSDSQCTTTGHCDLYSRQCTMQDTTGGGLLASCTRDAQCRSALCLDGLTPTPFCEVQCDTTNPVCPEDAACVAISNDPAYTLGLCFPHCTGGVGGTCATGFTCSARGNCLPSS